MKGPWAPRSPAEVMDRSDGHSRAGASKTEPARLKPDSVHQFSKSCRNKGGEGNKPQETSAGLGLYVFVCVLRGKRKRKGDLTRVNGCKWQGLFCF